MYSFNPDAWVYIKAKTTGPYLLDLRRYLAFPAEAETLSVGPAWGPPLLARYERSHSRAV